MEEPLLAANVADRGLRYRDALEAPRREPGRRRARRLHLFDVRHPDHVADRQDSRDPVAVHHRQVAEAALPEELEALLHGVGHRDRDRVLGHDLLDLGGARVDAVPDRAEQVALTQHPAQPALLVQHGRGTDIRAVQDHRSLRQGDRGRHDHRRLVHHVGDGQRGGHAVSLALCAGDLGAVRVSAAQRGEAPERHDLRPHDRRLDAALGHRDMDPEAYRHAAHRVADWTADYLRDVERFPVLSPTAAGSGAA